MDKERIDEMMHELEEYIEYKFNNIDLLAQAMYVQKVHCENDGKNHDEYRNEGLATVGDAILNSVITVDLYKEEPELKRKGTLTNLRKCYVCNKVLHKLVIDEDWINFSYNDKYFFGDKQPKEEKMPNPKHDSFVEAVVAAIYFDSDYFTVEKWILKTLYPMLRCYSWRC